MKERKDEIVRVVTKDLPVRAAAITGRDLIERARQIHQTTPVATAALGRALLAASLLGDQLKEPDHSLTFRIKGDGPIQTILAVSDADGCVRGYAQVPDVDLPLREDGKLDVGRAVGRNGTLTIIKDLGLKEPYTGTIPLVSGEIAEDVTQYLAVSEQIPSACALGVLVARDQSVLRAGGYLIQLLPGADASLIDAIETGIQRLGPVTTALLQDGMDAEKLLQRVLEGFPLETVGRHPVAYRCPCNRARVERALISLGKNELSALIDEQGSAVLTCQFCDRVQRFSRDELLELLQQTSH